MTYDLVVSGGGPSGVMAAISAARLGLKTLLIERYGFLGGMNTTGLVGPVMTFHAGKLQIVRGVAGGIFDELKTRGGSPGHLVDPIWGNTSLTPIDTEMYKALLFEEVTQAGVELLLHSQVLSGEREGTQVRAVRVASKKGLSQIQARYFIDATGDGDLAAALGCPFVLGRAQDQLTQPMTLMFKMDGVDETQVRDAIRDNPTDFYLGFPLEQYLALPALAVAGFFGLVKKAQADGTFPVPGRDRILFFGLPKKGEVSVNTLRISHVNGTLPEDLTRAESTLRQLVYPLARFLNEHVPGFAQARVMETAAQVGVRETRHIQGHYVLRAQDIYDQRPFEDVIAHASYPIDLHSPDGSGMKIVDPRRDKPESFYDIPLRSLLPVGFDNLLIAGRCISAEHEASASSRISATCMAIGEACGVVVREAIEQGGAKLAAVDPARVQAQLKRQGAFIELRK